MVWFHSNGSNRNKAIRALKVELNKQGFETDYPPDVSSMEYKLGAEIWVPMPGKFTAEDRAKNCNKIQKITERIAGQFGLNAIGISPVMLENALYFVCCGFRK